MNPLRPFLSRSFFVPKYTGPLPEFDPGDVVELEEETEVIQPVTVPVTVDEKRREI